jgi:SAM-dependent methyltransferase
MICKICSSTDLHSIIPLGKLPLANALLKKPRKQEAYNLEVLLCTQCGLAQLKDLIPPSALFVEYVYFSSNSETMLSSAKDLTQTIMKDLPEDAFVVELASNDGYLLKNYVQENIHVLGIDPAKNIAEEANKKGIPTLSDFFTEALSHKIVENNGKANIIHANNVLAHVPALQDFVAGIKNLLKEDGFAVIEVPYFLDLVQKLEFDTIYHEHVFYFGLKPLRQLFKNHNLHIFDYEKLSIHGGTCRLFIGHDHIHKEFSQLDGLIQQEEKCALYQLKTFEKFMENLATLKNNVKNQLELLKKANKKIAAYGASAKGTTLLNFFDIPVDVIEFVVDRSIAKQGLYTPGKNFAILHPDELIKHNIDVAFLLSWNFKEEIVRQQKEFLDKGGKFLCPLPEVEYIESTP